LHELNDACSDLIITLTTGGKHCNTISALDFVYANVRTYIFR